MNVDRADVIVIGAGPAGLNAACAAASFGAKVIVLDESSVPGGLLRSQLYEKGNRFGKVTRKIGAEQVSELVSRTLSAGCRILCSVSVWGVFPGWQVHLVPTDPVNIGSIPEVVEGSAVIIATGAVQRPLALPGWTLPGVLTTGAVQALVNEHRVRPGLRAVVIGTDSLALLAARHLELAGTQVLGILPPFPNPYVGLHQSPVDVMSNFLRFSHYSPRLAIRIGGRFLRNRQTAKLAAYVLGRRPLALWGTPLMLRQCVKEILGTGCVSAVRVVSTDAKGIPQDEGGQEWPVDTVVVSAGLFPLIDIALLAGCQTVYQPNLGGHVPLYSPHLEATVSGIFVAGSITGIIGAEVAASQGHLAGTAAIAYLGIRPYEEIEMALSLARHAVVISRGHSLPFVSGLAEGVSAMSRSWESFIRRSPSRRENRERQSGH